MGVGAAAIPSIASGAGSILGGIFGRPKLSRPSPEEGSALTGGLGTTANLRRQGAQLFGQGGQQLAGASQFLNPLLFGDRSAIRAALMPQIQSLRDQEQGVLRSLEGRGGEQRVAQNQLRTQRFAREALLPSLLRGQAAGTAANLGLNLSNLGTSATTGAAGLFAGLQNQLAQQRLAEDQLRQSLSTGGGVIGRGIFEALRGAFPGTSGGPGALPSSPIGTGNIGLIPSPPRNLAIPGTTGNLPSNPIEGFRRNNRNFFPVGA